MVCVKEPCAIYFLINNAWLYIFQHDSEVRGVCHVDKLFLKYTENPGRRHPFTKWKKSSEMYSTPLGWYSSWPAGTACSKGSSVMRLKPLSSQTCQNLLSVPYPSCPPGVGVPGEMIRLHRNYLLSQLSWACCFFPTTLFAMTFSVEEPNRGISPLFSWQHVAPWGLHGPPSWRWCRM